MNERITASILQRVPLILAVTAASYGLAPQERRRHLPRNARVRRPMGRTTLNPPDRMREELALG